MLRQKGVDIKTAQELLRHANSRITQDITSSLSAKKSGWPRTLFSGVCLKGA